MDTKVETAEKTAGSHRIGFDSSKRTFLKLIGAVSLVIGTVNWEKICQFLESLDISKEEKQALEEINRTPPDQRLHNLVVESKEGANLRKQPFAPRDPHDNEGNPIVGKLEFGARVPEAITFPGRDPNMPDASAKAPWYAIPTSTNPDGKVHRLVFSYSGNFK